MTTNIIPINKFDILFKKIMYTVLTISICKYINFIPTFVDNLIILLATLYLIYLLPQFLIVFITIEQPKLIRNIRV